MEAVGFAASVIGIIQVAGKLTSITYGYISSFKRAPKDIRELANELHSLVIVLESLQDYAATNPSSPMLQKLNEVDGPIPVFFEELNELYLKFNAIDNPSFIERLKWPLKDKDVSEYILRIERHKSLFSFALNADHISLSKAIEAYVMNIDLATEYIEAYVRDTAFAVQEIKGDVKNTNLTVQEIRTDVGETNMAIRNLQSAQNTWNEQNDAAENAKIRSEVLGWLYSEPFETKHVEISGRRRKGTGEWLLNSPEFWKFKNNRSSPLLWGYGIPGAGKTFLSSAVIDHLQDKARENNYGVAYIYFDYKEQNQQKPLQVLASLVKQLATQAPQLPTEIIDLHKKLTKENKRPTQQELYPVLVSILKSFSQSFFVFDALDECDQNRQRKELLPLFHRMVQENSTVSMLLTSRQYPEDIQVSFSNSAKIELRANDEDIKNYIQQKIDENARAKRLVKGELEDKIISELTKCANGMFLLVHFHIELICQQTTPRKITKELERLKHESSTIGNNRSTAENSPLDPTYDRAVKSIRTQARSCVELATKIFTWLVKAQRPLTVDELRMAVSIEPNLYELDDEDLPDKATLLDVCAGLVTIDEKSSTVRLAHYTVQEYLLKSSLIPEDANAELAITCITFLSFDIFTQGACKSDELLESRIKAYPFLKYAVFQLPSHLKCCDETLSTESFLKFLENPGSVACYSQIVHCIDKIHGEIKESYWDYCYPCFPEQFPLHVASAVGHHAALQALLSKGADISARCSDLETALHVAARHGHEAVVMLLLENSADITVTNKLQYTALHLAAENGHDAVTRLLLEKGADISARCYMQETPLHKAAIHGHEAVARLLLENGADITLTNKSGLTALQLAAGKGHCSVTRLLLENGADISARCHMQETALHKATIHGHEAVVRLLLENGADVTQKNIFDYTALHCASEQGHYAVARLLLENGADISAKTEWGETPLLKAVGSGRKAIIQLLIDRGSDCFERSSTGVTPFEYAVWGEREDIARLIQPTIVSHAGTYVEKDIFYN